MDGAGGSKGHDIKGLGVGRGGEGGASEGEGDGGELHFECKVFRKYIEVR